MCETHILETKNVGLYTWRGGGRGSEKVYCLYNHENVDIFGWPISNLIIITIFKGFFMCSYTIIDTTHIWLT